ncbi:hypothetical protein OROGR_001790 [Orobanche gracilis]
MASSSSVPFTTITSTAKFQTMTEKLINATVKIVVGKRSPWTGTIVASKSGGSIILTAAHCLHIQGMTMEEVSGKLKVILHDDSVYDATICCCLFESEIALLRITRKTPAKYVFDFAPQSQWELRHQQPIIGVGHPQGTTYRSGTSEICSPEYYNPFSMYTPKMILFDHRLDFVSGCSGASIINEDGNIIGLQSGSYAITTNVMGARPFDVLLRAKEKELEDASIARRATLENESLAAEMENLNAAMGRVTANFSDGSFMRSDITSLRLPTSNMKIAVHIKYINTALREQVFGNDLESPLQNLIENYFLWSVGSSSGGTRRPPPRRK